MIPSRTRVIKTPLAGVLRRGRASPTARLVHADHQRSGGSGRVAAVFGSTRRRAEVKRIIQARRSRRTSVRGIRAGGITARQILEAATIRRRNTGASSMGGLVAGSESAMRSRHLLQALPLLPPLAAAMEGIGVRRKRRAGAGCRVHADRPVCSRRPRTTKALRQRSRANERPVGGACDGRSKSRDRSSGKLERTAVRRLSRAETFSTTNERLSLPYRRSGPSNQAEGWRKLVRRCSIRRGRREYDVEADLERTISVIAGADRHEELRSLIDAVGSST